jgi:hypothetical protein
VLVREGYITERAQTLILSHAGLGLPTVPKFDEEIGRFYQGTLPHPDTPPHSQLFPRSLLNHDVFEEATKVLT